MNYEKNKPLDLNSALILSEEIAKSKSPKAKFILDHSININLRGYLNLCFAYLRWVDDFVDSPNILTEEKKPFIDRQLNFLSSLANGNKTDFNHMEESFLFHFVAFAKQHQNNFLVTAVRNMLDTIEMDARRLQSDGIFSASELEIFINKQAKALYDILLFFLLPEQYNEINNTPGRFHTKALIMRDLFEDIDAGLINISREDIKKFQLDLDSIKKKKRLKHWIEEQFKELHSLLIEEAHGVKTLPFKYKFLIFFSQSYYLTIITRLKAAGYYSIKSNLIHKTLQKVKTYANAFVLTIKVFRIEFIK